MAVTGTIQSIAANSSTTQFDITVRFSDGTRNANEVVSVDPGLELEAIERKIIEAGEKYDAIFANQSAWNLGVGSYQQYVGAVIAVT